MNGFLVLLCHDMYDLPAGLFATHTKALNCAEKLKGEPCGNVRAVFGTDGSTPRCVKVVTFSGGVPVLCEFVKSFV